MLESVTYPEDSDTTKTVYTYDSIRWFIFIMTGTSKPLIGGDGKIREIIEIPGEINGKQGGYEYIIGPDRWCNHRFFREWR